MGKSNFISVDNLHYAKLTEDSSGALTYGTVKPLPQAVKISVDPSSNQAEFYADGILCETATTLGQIKVALETGALDFPTLGDLLGATVNADGTVDFGKDDTPPYVALMYRRVKASGKARYMKIYKCQFGLPKEESATAESSVKFASDTIEGQALPLINNGKWKTMLDEDETGFTQATADAWFTSIVPV